MCFSSKHGLSRWRMRQDFDKFITYSYKSISQTRANHFHPSLHTCTPYAAMSAHASEPAISEACAMRYYTLPSSNLLPSLWKHHQEYQKAPWRSLSGLSFHLLGHPGPPLPKQHPDRDFHQNPRIYHPPRYAAPGDDLTTV